MQVDPFRQSLHILSWLVSETIILVKIQNMIKIRKYTSISKFALTLSTPTRIKNDPRTSTIFKRNFNFFSRLKITIRNNAKNTMHNPIQNIISS